MSAIKELTKAEEQVMQMIWKSGGSTVKEMVAQFPDPKPAVNTVSTIVRILESKEFVTHQKEGKGYRYVPIIKKEDYTKRYLGTMMKNYFSGSFSELVSFFAKTNEMDLKDIDALMQEVKNELSNPANSSEEKE